MRKRLALGVVMLGSVFMANAGLQDGDKFVSSSDVYEYYVFQVISENEATVEVKSIEFYYVEYYIGATIKIPDYVIDPGTGKEYKVISIGADFIAGYDRIAAVEIPSTVTEIGNGAFKGCKDMKRVEFGDSIVKIGQGAFHGCESLEMIRLPETVETIAVSAFSECTSLTAIIIPDSVTEIGSFAFGGCYSVGPLVIGKSVTFIDDGAFTWMPIDKYRSTTGIYEDLYMLPEAPPKLDDPYMQGTGKAYCPAGSLEKYRNSGAWSMVSSNFLPLPDIFMVFYKDRYLVEEGESVELLNKMYNPGDVEIATMVWEPFNDRAVEVKDGIATGLRSGEMTTVTCRITDTAGMEYEAKCKVEVTGKTGIDSVEDEDHGMDGVYTINGVKVGSSLDGLAPGMYIVRDGLKASKVMVK